MWLYSLYIKKKCKRNNSKISTTFSEVESGQVNVSRSPAWWMCANTQKAGEVVVALSVGGGSLVGHNYLCDAWMFLHGIEHSRIPEDLGPLLCLKPKKSWRPLVVFLAPTWLINHVSHWVSLEWHEHGVAYTETDQLAKGVGYLEKTRP